MLYQFVLVAEVIITVVFWVALWNFMSKTEDHLGHPWAMLNLITDHSAPLFVMLLDFTTVSTIPFCKRHIAGIIAIFILYMITNMIF